MHPCLRSARRLAVAPFLALAAPPTLCQLPPGLAVVATRLAPPGPATRLLAIDGSGGVAPFGPFPSDLLPPLAVEIDPIDRHLLLALDLGGQSLLVRLVPAGAAIASEQFLALVNGPVTQLAVVGDDLFATVGGPAGGLFLLPRRGGTAALVAAQPNLDAMAVFGQQPSGILAWTGSAAPPAPSGLAYADFTTGQLFYGPFPFGSSQPAVTGVVDLPTGLPRQLLSFADGTIAVFVGFLGPPVPIVLAPQPPPGGAVAMKAPGPALVAAALGGAAFPFLYDVDPTAGTVAARTGPLPGDPVDFALALRSYAQALPFGAPCGTPSLAIAAAGGPPQPGNALFRVDLGNGAPNQPALFVAGVADAAASGTPLPFALPGGCPLHVAPAAVQFQLTGGAGAASQPLPVPQGPALLGLIAFVQWLQAPGPAFLGSAALAIQIGT